MVYKQCTKCKKSFPRAKEYFHKANNGSTYRGKCKLCRNEIRRGYYKNVQLLKKLQNRSSEII